MSTFDTELDSINNICSLVGEIMQLSLDINSRTGNEKIEKDCALITRKAYTIKEKAYTIKEKAQKMENRLKEYKTTIESLGFKRIKDKRRSKCK